MLSRILALLSSCILNENKENGLTLRIISKLSRPFLCRSQSDFVKNKIFRINSDNNSNNSNHSNHSNNTLNSSIHNNLSNNNSFETPNKNLDSSLHSHNKKKSVRVEKGDFSGNINRNIFAYSGSPRSTGVGFTGLHFHFFTSDTLNKIQKKKF